MQCGPGVSCLQSHGQREAQSRERRPDSNACTALCSCSQVSSYHNIKAASELMIWIAFIPIYLVSTVVTGSSKTFGSPYGMCFHINLELKLEKHTFSLQAVRTDLKNKLLFMYFVWITELITDMLGSEKFRLVWEHVLESLQDPSINRYYNLNSL